MKKQICSIFVISIVLFSSLLSISAEMVKESARDIPVAYDVDVVVAGGSSAGVAAAVEAAQHGAKVFLAAPRPYLGEDLCATYRLWLEENEKPSTPLTQKMFKQPPYIPIGGKSMPFTYEADQPSAERHKDTDPTTMLSDGEWEDPYTQSVQYDNNVNIIADLGEVKQIKMIHVLSFEARDRQIQDITVSISNNKKNWKRVGVIENKLQGYGRSPMDIKGAFDEEARYVKLFIRKRPGMDRLLLGEILIESEITKKRVHILNAYAPRFGADRSVGLQVGEYIEEEIGPRLTPMPMQIKYTLDQALLDAGVEFLYSCYVTGVLHDENGKIAGVVMVNRSGRQAVKAKVVIDAMPRAEIARMAGVEFEPYPAGTQKFKRIVIGGEVQTGEGMTARVMPTTIRSNMGETNYQEHKAIEYTLEIPMKDASFASFAKAEQIARDKTWHPGMVDDSEELFQIPPDPMEGKKGLEGGWPGVKELDLDVLRPAKIERMYVLGACADVSRQAAEELLRPLTYVALGKRVGKAAAAEAKMTAELSGVHLSGPKAQEYVEGDVGELLVGLRPTEEKRKTIPAKERALPILGEYDVAVIGGGTGGAPAGISAARQGAKTLVVEYLHGLGGVGTLGLIGVYYHGYREGFTAEIDEGVQNMADEKYQKERGWNIQLKMEWFRSELRKAGADIWFGALGCGSFVDNGQVKGVAVATPQGRGVILTEATIDATGSSDIAIAAGADYMYTDAEHSAMQGTGLPPHQPGAHYTNTDYTYTDESDMKDTWRTFIVARAKYKGAYDLGQLIDTRERRRIVGEYIQTPVDIFNFRTYPDTVNLSSSNFDTHGFTIHPIVMLKPPDRRDFPTYTPYRCMLPKGLDEILVIGLGISAHRDAMPFLRMQPDIQNQGYAMGYAAAMAVNGNKSVREIDINILQKHLVDIGNLPKSVLTDKDSFPVSKDKVKEAVQNVKYELKGEFDLSGDRIPPPNMDPIGVILAQPDDALPFLKQAYKSSDEKEDQLIYAKILGMLGDPTGSETLIDAIETGVWDQEDSLYGRRQSHLDDIIITLGNSGDKNGVEPVLEKMEKLTASDAFSHFRAVARALESLNDPKAAKPLAELLQKPNMRGYALTDVETELEIDINKIRSRTRYQSLRELILARALYRCGDYQGLGEKILKEYVNDLRGHHSRHAHAILEEGK